MWRTAYINTKWDERLNELDEDKREEANEKRQAVRDAE